MTDRSPQNQTLTPTGRLSRRSLLAATPTLLATAGLLTQVTAIGAQEVEDSSRGDLPTTGGLRPGPVGMNPRQVRRKGVEPVAIKIESAEVDSPVETTEIVDGVMQNPSGPYVVSWYRGTGKLNQDNNIVMAGHLDYYDVGEAVFYNLGKVKEKDVVEVTGSDEIVYQYAVESVEDVDIAELTAEEVQAIVGKTSGEILTLITCSGTFDAGAQQYSQRKIVRAKRK